MYLKKIKKIEELKELREALIYKEHYLEQDEYQKMKNDLDIVLERTSTLIENVFPNQKIEQAIFASNLISMGYFSVTGKYTYNDKTTEIGFYKDLFFELALVPFTGEGCCRHSSALHKLLSERLGIENEMVLVDTTKTEEDIARIKMFLSEFHHKRLGENHTANYVTIGADKFFIEPLYESDGTLLSYNEEGFLNHFWPKLIEENRNFLYNYSSYYEGRKPITETSAMSVKRQREFISKYNKVTHTIQNNLNLINFFKAQNGQYVENINNNYQKVLVKERKNGFIN